MSRRLALFALFALVVAAVCARLGLWQLSRLDERRRANAAVQARLVAPPVPLESLPAEPEAARWRRVRLDGTLDYEREAVLANRTRDGSPGVNLFTPLRRPGTDTVVFVNRGWVYAPDGRTVDRPRWREATVADGAAYVERFPETPSAGPAGASSDSVVLRRLDRALLARRVGLPVAPYYVVLLPDTAAAADPRAVARQVGRLGAPALDEGPHLSYAIQWFSFALIAVGGVIGLWVAERRRTGSRKEAGSRT